jgi:hypothetical protein
MQACLVLAAPGRLVVGGSAAGCLLVLEQVIHGDHLEPRSWLALHTERQRGRVRWHQVPLQLSAPDPPVHPMPAAQQVRHHSPSAAGPGAGTRAAHKQVAAAGTFASAMMERAREVVGSDDSRPENVFSRPRALSPRSSSPGLLHARQWQWQWQAQSYQGCTTSRGCTHAACTAMCGPSLARHTPGRQHKRSTLSHM